MSLVEEEPRVALIDKIIKPDKEITLQEHIDKAIGSGEKVIYLEGEFEVDKPSFSLVRIPDGVELEIVGIGNTVLRGDGACHVVFVGDEANVTMSNLKIEGGNTANTKGRMSTANHPGDKLNLFRYLDGGGISMGNSKVTLVDCAILNNNAKVCGGGVSIMGGQFFAKSCSFVNNTANDTGSAVDVLCAGSLAHLTKCKFEDNKANIGGDGNYGAITAFGDTYLIVVDCDFQNQDDMAIDYRYNDQGKSFIYLENNLLKDAKQITNRPSGNNNTRRITIPAYGELLLRRGKYIKHEDVPRASDRFQRENREYYEDFHKNIVNH
ncbi:hypothetical protein IPM62_03355 [Candidatus Woesebacteria bacterium]|nr:MAG: hypothetical protein IPM62_03355 [Candidatus Woesebacteria bacterium]